MLSATICFLTHFHLIFLLADFIVRRYNGSYLSCCYPPPSNPCCPMKFTTFIDESAGKNKSISSTHGDFKILP